MSRTMSGVPFRPNPGEESDAAAGMAPLDGRRLTVLLDLSNKCNIRCRMCYFSYDSVFHRPAEYLSPALFDKIAAETFEHARVVCLSAGSEPMTSPHFVDLVRRAGQYGVPHLKFLTNGLLMGPAAVEAILDGGVDAVDVSIDGGTRQTYERIRVGASFDRLCRNLALLRDRKRARGLSTPIVQFNLTLMRSNLDELDAFVDLACELGVGRIAARHLMPYQGLDMERESLALDPRSTDRRFHAFLDHAARAGMPVVAFPDFFGGGPPEGAASPRAKPAADDAKGPAADAPFGHIDLPAATTTPGTNAIRFVGWALDPVGVARVRIECSFASVAERSVSAERPDPSVRHAIGEATILNGGRGDVADAYPDIPFNYRAGWSFELRRDELPFNDAAVATVHVLVESLTGRTTEIGTRRIEYAAFDRAEPFLYCKKPFDSVYFDSGGNAYPYPDCKSLDPFASISTRRPFRELWFNRPFTELRERIIRRDPPEMCLDCPDFINRNVNDPAYFSARPVEHDYRRPVGTVTAAVPGGDAGLGSDVVELRGWTLGFEEFVGVEIVVHCEADGGDRAAGGSAMPSAHPFDVEAASGESSLGWAEFHDGRPPSVTTNIRVYPNHRRAIWTFLVHRERLPNVDEIVLRALARNRGDARPTVLGTLRLDGADMHLEPLRPEYATA